MKVLCLGNNTKETDIKTRCLAKEDLAECHGLLSELGGNTIVTNLLPGWYHSSIYDVEYNRLLDLANKFDLVIMLDQPRDRYSHADAFYRTVDLVKNLPNGKLLNPEYATNINFFEEIVKTNKSFCIFPFIDLTNLRTDGQTTICCRSAEPITHVSKVVNWQTNKEYNDIRNNMINGVLIPTHCSSCYELENKNILSARQQETVEWVTRLNLTSIDDLKTITHPACFEVHVSDICNLQCRMCVPISSRLIAREYKKLNLIKELPQTYHDGFDIVDFTNLKKLYVTGGEPLATPSFFNFINRCIENKKTDFEFSINTNATKLSNRFKKQLKHFSNMHFIVSIEGYGPLNYYIRWPSVWDNIIKNIHYLRKHKHSVAINITVSIYNVIGLYDLLKFFDNEFPGLLVHCGACLSDNDRLSGFRFPDSNLVVDKLLLVQQLNCYKNDKLLKSFIDGLILYYQSNPTVDLEKLKEFFEFNDKLDQSRNIKLVDYIPELEQFRTLIK